MWGHPQRPLARKMLQSGRRPGEQAAKLRGLCRSCEQRAGLVPGGCSGLGWCPPQSCSPGGCGQQDISLECSRSRGEAVSETPASSARCCLWEQQSTRAVGRQLHGELIASNPVRKLQPLGKQHTFLWAWEGRPLGVEFRRNNLNLY